MRVTHHKKSFHQLSTSSATRLGHLRKQRCRYSFQSEKLPKKIREKGQKKGMSILPQGSSPTHRTQHEHPQSRIDTAASLLLLLFGVAQSHASNQAVNDGEAARCGAEVLAEGRRGGDQRAEDGDEWQEVLKRPLEQCAFYVGKQ